MSLKLSINHLEAVQAIAESSSLSSAAQALNITQPALSHRIREAESRLETVLFNRHNKKLSLSNAGKRILLTANTILDQLAQAEYEIELMNEGVDQVIKVSARTYSCYHWLPSILRKFRDSYPKTNIQIVADATSDPMFALKHNIIDVAIVNEPPSDVSSHKLFDDEMVAVVPKNHPLAKEDFLTAQDFTGEVYITNNTKIEKDREYELFFDQQNIKFKEIMQAGLTETIIELVRNNFGVTILTRWVLNPYLKSGELVAIPLTKQGIFVKWYACTRQASELNPKLLLLINELSKQANMEAKVC